jgi:hypothetical protein
MPTDISPRPRKPPPALWRMLALLDGEGGYANSIHSPKFADCCLPRARQALVPAWLMLQRRHGPSVSALPASCRPQTACSLPRNLHRAPVLMLQHRDLDRDPKSSSGSSGRWRRGDSRRHAGLKCQPVGVSGRPGERSYGRRHDQNTPAGRAPRQRERN